MDLDVFHRHIRELALLEESDSPIISCYLDIAGGRHTCLHHIKERSRLIARSLTGRTRKEFKECVTRIETFVEIGPAPETRGAAVFVRGGSDPFYLPLEFRVHLPNRFAVDMTPNIYNLVELEDTCRHYVVVMVTQDSARILEVHLGEVTATAWSEMPEGRRRVGREWTREHYRASRRERGEKFIREQVQVIDDLMADGGYGHIVLVGPARATARFRKAMPKHLADALVDTIPAAGDGKLQATVDATLKSFFEREQNESLATVDKLKRGLHTDGLAVVGAAACRKALKNGQVDTLVIAREFEKPEVQEELVKLATVAGSVIETVGDSFTLLKHGGVGCILRYLLPDQYREPSPK